MSYRFSVRYDGDQCEDIMIPPEILARTEEDKEKLRCILMKNKTFIRQHFALKSSFQDVNFKHFQNQPQAHIANLT